jgi:hypothetical protein
MFYLVQAGASLQILRDDGVVFGDVVLPSGVTVDPTLRAQIAVLTQKVIVANSVSKNIWIDPATFNAYLLGILAPTTAPVASVGAAGVLLGDYKFAYTFVHKISGIVMNESPLSDISNTVTLTNQMLHGTVGVLPAGDWTGRRIYRTASGGTSLFEAFDIDDLVTTTFDDNTPDLALGDLPFDLARINAPGGSDGASRLTLLIEWKNYLWAVASQPGNVDTVFRSELGQMYAWNQANSFPASPVGEDAAGVVAFIKRRDAIGIGKRSRILKIVGSSDEDFQILGVVENIGVEATESVRVIRDKGYWLGTDGTYRWDDDGVLSISRDKVDPWFVGTRQTTPIFDRTQFSKAIGAWNSATNCYELGLVPTGGSDLTQWIAFELDLGEWLGPHFTDAFTPTARGLLRTDDAVLRPTIGASDGFLYLQNQGGADDIDGPTVTHVAIVPALTPKWLHNGDPQMFHLWGRLALLTRQESAGTLDVTRRIGTLKAADGPLVLSYDLTKTTEIKSNLGGGQLCRLRFTQGRIGEQFLLFGVLISPVLDLGRRS